MAHIPQSHSEHAHSTTRKKKSQSQEREKKEKKNNAITYKISPLRTEAIDWRGFSSHANKHLLNIHVHSPHQTKKAVCEPKKKKKEEKTKKRRSKESVRGSSGKLIETANLR